MSGERSTKDAKQEGGVWHARWPQHTRVGSTPSAAQPVQPQPHHFRCFTGCFLDAIPCGCLAWMVVGYSALAPCHWSDSVTVKTSMRMGSQSTHRYLPHFGKLIASAAILCASTVGMRAGVNRSWLSSRHHQWPARLRHIFASARDPRMAVRPFWSPWDRQRRFPGTGFGFGGFVPWYPGGFNFPPVYGSWYQRPYPYHFDIYRGRFGGNPQTRPDAMGQFGPIGMGLLRAITRDDTVAVNQEFHAFRREVA